MYHVMRRGDRREDIFREDVDRQDFLRACLKNTPGRLAAGLAGWLRCASVTDFLRICSLVAPRPPASRARNPPVGLFFKQALKTLAEACQKTGWEVHAYCLMRNHYHLVLETPNANLVAGMAWLQSSYTSRLNHRHKRIGHVLSGRYQAQLVEGSGSGYLRTACDYVHLNPARARLLEPGDQERLKALRRGWCLGTEGFRQELLERAEGRLGEHPSGALRQESAAAKAERMIGEELGCRGWREADLAARRKGDAGKLEIAARVRRETTLTLKQIAKRLQLGTPRSAGVRLHLAARQPPRRMPA